MKKVLALVAAVMLTSAAFAEKVVEVGLKGGVLLNAGTKSYYDDESQDEGRKMSVGGDIGIFGHFGLVEIGSGALSLQPELFFSIANGLKYEVDMFGYSYKDTYKFNTLDIAVLIGYDIPLGKARLTPFLGPKLGFAVGKIKDVVETDGDKETYTDTKAKGVGFGLDFGVGFAVPLGHFVLGADVRYGIDFTKFKETYDGEDTGMKMRRGALGINLTAGYRF